MRPAGIVVTGAGGWIGSRLTARLVEDGVPGVVPLARSDLDCTDARRVEEVLAEVRPRTVMHLASSLARGVDREATDSQWRDTFLAGRTVVRAAARAGVSHLVLLGTMEELGDQCGELDVDLPAQPLTTYGLCKSLVREVASFEARGTPGLRIDWCRPTTVYGPAQRGTMLVPFACAAAVAGRPAPFTAGEQQRDFLYVDDLVDWLRLAGDQRVGSGGRRGVHLHHLGSGAAVAVRDVLRLIAGESPGADFRLGALPRRPHEPPLQVAPTYSSADPVLGAWAPRTSWPEGVRRTLAWWRDQSPEGQGLED